MPENTQEASISLKISEIQEITKAFGVITLLPYQAFVYSVFLIIALFGLQGYFPYLPEEHRTGIFILIIISAFSIGLYLWKTSTAYQRFLHSIKKKDDKSKKILRTLTQHTEEIKVKYQQLSDIRTRLKKLEESSHIGNTDQNKRLMADISKVIESHLNILNQLLLDLSLADSEPSDNDCLGLTASLSAMVDDIKSRQG